MELHDYIKKSSRVLVSYRPLAPFCPELKEDKAKTNSLAIEPRASRARGFLRRQRLRPNCLAALAAAALLQQRATRPITTHGRFVPGASLHGQAQC